MHLKNFKHIVTSGCSYGQMGNSISNVTNSQFNKENIINKLCNEDHSLPYFSSKGDVVVWDFALRSQSSEWISDTIERVINVLLKNGVPIHNIYVYCEWTTWDRISVDVYDWLNLQNNDLEIEPESNNFGIGFPVCLRDGNIFPVEEARGILLPIFKEINIGSSNGNIGRIGNRFYLTPTHTHEDDFKSVKSKKWHQLAREYELTIPTEVKITNYLNNIIRTQNFLKKYNINYNFIFMQQSLGAWKRDVVNNTLLEFRQISEYKLQYIIEGNIITNENFKPVASISGNIENVYLPANSKINEIDFDNIWFYKTDKYERGGIDEWAIDNFGIGCMTHESLISDIISNKRVPNEDLITNFGFHPNSDLYKLLWNLTATNCKFFKINQIYKDRLTEMVYEDLNHSGISKNGILISKKQLNRISPTIFTPKKRVL
jgi:hypothetical protein